MIPVSSTLLREMSDTHWAVKHCSVVHGCFPMRLFHPLLSWLSAGANLPGHLILHNLPKQRDDVVGVQSWESVCLGPCKPHGSLQILQDRTPPLVQARACPSNGVGVGPLFSGFFQTAVFCGAECRIGRL